MITRRARRWLRRGATAAAVLVVLAVVVGTWVTTEQIDALLLEVEAAAPTYDLEVAAVGDGTVTLPRTPATSREGTWGLEWETGYARLGAVVGGTSTTVTREVVDLRGRLEAGDLVAMDRFAFESDPGDLGLGFRTVAIEGPLGEYPAWRVDGTDDTWVVLVHGRGATRREALRALGTVAAMDFPALVVTYRNDPPAPESPNRRHSLGKHEWRDLEAAVEYAIVEGAADVVLVGYGMGGGIAATFVRESEWGERVIGMVLDAPLLDGGVVVDEAVSGDDVPGFVIALSKGLAALRYGVDWGERDQIRHADELEIPILLFHGTDDEEIPVRSSDRFVEAAGGLVRYERLEGAGHGEAWNVGTSRYEAALRTFLNANGRGRSDLDAPDPEMLEELRSGPTEDLGAS